MKKRNPTVSTLEVDNSREGVSLENRLEKMLANGEMIKGEAPLIYTGKKEGVQPAYNIRSDRFDIAIDGMDKINKSYTARRESKAKMDVVPDDNSEAETIQGTN